MGQDPITLIIRTLGEIYVFMLVLRFPAAAGQS